jgi:predicted small lipoprotein YifL
MRRILPAALRALSAALLAVLLLGGCGLKGDLVLPADAPAEADDGREDEDDDA